MAAFERILCGISGLDEAFDSIRLGDNVVWQLDALDDFRSFSDPFARQAREEGKTVHYMRFATHPPLLEEGPGVEVHHLNPHVGFEAFTIDVRSVITEQGMDAYYVFDCLSELQTAWSADLMMGNFFRLTCPYLFSLDTVAYFPILRGRHSFDAVAKIRETTQLLIDVYRDGEGSFFVHPLKVWNRYSPTMFLAHSYSTESGRVAVCTDGANAARFYAVMGNSDTSDADRNIDSWDRFFMDARRKHAQGELDDDMPAKMCNMMMTKDPLMRSLIKRYFKPEDYFAVRERMVGTGHIGGKACGMLLARKIVESDLNLDDDAIRMEAHDSFYIGTDVFYSYIVANNLWALRCAQREKSGFISEAAALQEGLLGGSFPQDIREHFRRMLDYYGQSPIIVRSSSYLEDGFGNAFAGKYESVFCPNAGDAEERLEEFENAVRRVYASTMDVSALEYRLRNGLDGREEQMAVLVQRVSGSRIVDEKGGRVLFAPDAAGVGYSHAAYRFMEGLDPEAGMLRLVVGLGTKAVDRTSADYPRIASLDDPLAMATKSIADKHHYSQHYADVLDLGGDGMTEINVQDLYELLPARARRAGFEHDIEAERLFRERGQHKQIVFASCEGLVENKAFVSAMRDMLRALQCAYDYAVDIEYTVNVGDDDSLSVNLLQCRPLRMMADASNVKLPEPDERDILFSACTSSMGRSRAHALDYTIVVDPERYYRCPHALKSIVAREVGYVRDELFSRYNRQGVDGEPAVLLFAPGRIGTSSPELGVPVSFAQIAGLTGICEVTYSKAGYSPELSYGSHMFQDLVEADIYYAALLEDSEKVTYRPCAFERLDDITAEILGDEVLAGFSSDESLSGIVRVYDAGKSGLALYHDHLSNRSVCGFTEEPSA